jgi:hypothetical protein
MTVGGWFQPLWVRGGGMHTYIPEGFAMSSLQIPTSFPLLMKESAETEVLIFLNEKLFF